MAKERYVPLTWVNEPLEKAKQCRFTRASSTDDANALSCAHLKRDIFQRIRFPAEGDRDMIEDIKIVPLFPFWQRRNLSIFEFGL